LPTPAHCWTIADLAAAITKMPSTQQPNCQRSSPARNARRRSPQEPAEQEARTKLPHGIIAVRRLCRGLSTTALLQRVRAFRSWHQRQKSESRSCFAPSRRL